MSKDARDWAWTVDDLTMGERVILLYLAERAHPSGLSWPKPATIAESTRAGRATVWRALGSFIKRGLITDEGPGSVPGGTRDVEHRYRLHITSDVFQIGTELQGDSVSKRNITGLPHVSKRNVPRRVLEQPTIHPETDVFQIGTTYIEEEPSLKGSPEPSFEPIAPAQPSLPKPKRPKREKTLSPELQEAVAFWESHGHPKPISATATTELKSFVEGYGLELTKRIILKAAAEGFIGAHSWMRVVIASEAARDHQGGRNGASERRISPDGHQATTEPRAVNPRFAGLDGPSARFPG